jgi:hypothetical protein
MSNNEEGCGSYGRKERSYTKTLLNSSARQHQPPNHRQGLDFATLVDLDILIQNPHPKLQAYPLQAPVVQLKALA